MQEVFKAGGKDLKQGKQGSGQEKLSKVQQDMWLSLLFLQTKMMTKDYQRSEKLV